MRALGCTLAALALAACGPANPAVATPPLDHALYLRTVESVLEQRCAVPSCHGNPRRPLATYATDRYRMDPSRLRLPEAISPEEVAANERSASAFAVGITNAADSMLITKSLGTVFHQGGVVWGSVDDPECQAVLAWLRSGGLR